MSQQPPTPPVYVGGLSRKEVLAWRNAIFVVFGLAGLGFSSWASRLPAVRDSLDLRVDQVGVLVFAVAAGSIVGLTLSSHIVARSGARMALLGGLIITAAGLATAGAGAGAATSFALTFVGLFIYGSMTGIIDVAMNVSGAANERTLGRTIMPIFHAFFSFGTMVGAGLGALAELAGIGVTTHLGVIAVTVVLTTVVAAKYIKSEELVEEGAEPTTEDDHSRTWRGRLSMWKDPQTLLLGLLVLSAGFAEGSANDWVAIAMVDGHFVSNETGAVVLGVFLTTMTIGRLAGVMVIDKFGRVPTLRVSFLVAAIGLCMFIFIPDPWLAGVGAALWGVGAALGFPVGMSAAADDPRTAAARVSVVATIGYGAFLVGPPLIGFLGHQFGILGALLLVVALAGIGALVSGSTREPARPAEM